MNFPLCEVKSATATMCDLADIHLFICGLSLLSDPKPSKPERRTNIRTIYARHNGFIFGNSFKWQEQRFIHNVNQSPNVQLLRPA